MSNKKYDNIICIHPKDESTRFLFPLGRIFNENYVSIEDNDNSHDEILNVLQSFSNNSLVVFLGHGHSYGLSSAQSVNYNSKIFIDSNLANELFKNHDVILLACRSSEFISSLDKNYNSIIGFGNILSSLEEVQSEGLYETGSFRNLEQIDVDYFNNAYVGAISKSLSLLFDNKISFKQMTSYICYFLNKSINEILKTKDRNNRIEVAKLLFEFREEMIHI